MDNHSLANEIAGTNLKSQQDNAPVDWTQNNGFRSTTLTPSLSAHSDITPFEKLSAIFPH